jgi:uncharacterized Zn-binding protein involved in type VI secretion
MSQLDSESATRDRECGMVTKDHRNPCGVAVPPPQQTAENLQPVKGLESPPPPPPVVVENRPFRTISFSSPELWERERVRQRSLSRSGILVFKDLPRVPAFASQLGNYGPPNDDGGKTTPDVFFNDITRADIDDVLGAASREVSVDDVYPVQQNVEEVDATGAEYQGMVEYLVFVQVVWRVFFFNVVFNFIRIFAFLFQHKRGIFNFFRSGGAKRMVVDMRRRQGTFGVFKAFGLLTTAIAFIFLYITVVSTYIGVALAMVTQAMEGDYTLFYGYVYGVTALGCWAMAMIEYPFSKWAEYRWSKRLPDHFRVIAVHGKGAVCLAEIPGEDKAVFFVRLEDKLRCYKMPKSTWKSAITAWESIVQVSHGSMDYTVYYKSYVQINRCDIAGWDEWNVWTLSKGGPVRPSPSAVFTGRDVGSAPELGDRVDDPDATEAVVLDTEVVQEVDTRGAVYQGSRAGPGDFTSMLRSVQELPGCEGRTISIVTDVVALIVLFMETRSKKVMLTQALALIVRYPELGDSVIEEIKKVIDRFDTVEDHHIEDGFGPQYQAFSTGFRDTEIGTEFMNLITLFTAGGVSATLGILDISFVKSLQSAANHMMAFETLQSVTVRFAKFVAAVVKTLKKCIEQRSFAPLYEGVTMNPSRYVKLATELMNEVRIRDSSNTAAYMKAIDTFDVDLRNGQLSEGQRVVMMEELYALGQRFESLKRGDNEQLIYSLILNARLALKREIDSLNTKTELNRFKTEPYGLGLIGPPGIGKSFLVRSAQRVVAAHLGLNDSASIGFQWRVGQKYADGLTSAKRVYVFDDCDQKEGAPAFADQSPYIDWILVRNSKPTMANMAEAQDKGRYAYNSLMAIWVSNTMPTVKDVGLHVKDHHAFARRFNKLWWCELSSGTSVKDAEAGRVKDNSWVFTEYRWNSSARDLTDELFVKTGVVLTSRLELLKVTAVDFSSKMSVEKVKMENANALDKPPCGVCGISGSDHFDYTCETELVATGEATPAATFYSTRGDAPSIMVYQGPDDVEPIGESPLAAVARVRDKAAELTAEDFNLYAGYVIATCYLLHVATMFWGMWFITLMIEALILVTAVGVARMDDDTKVRMSLMLFPRTTLLWLMSKGVVNFKLPSLERVASSIRQSSAMDKLMVFLPVLTALGVVLWAWSSSGPSYQSVTTSDDPEVVRTQPKKEQWSILENTPRNVSTPAAKTYGVIGFKRAVQSGVASVKVNGKNIAMHYVNSKTWVTNAHLLMDGAPPRFSEVSVPMVFPDVLRVELTLGTFTETFELPTKTCVVQVPGRDVAFVRIDDMVSPGAGIYPFLAGDIDVNGEYAAGELLDVTDTMHPTWRRMNGLCKYKKMKGTGKVMFTYDCEVGNNYGMCASLSCAPSASGGWLVLGMHSAGVVGSSFGEPLTRAMVEREAASLYPGAGPRKATDQMSYQCSLLRDPGQMGPGSDLVVAATYGRTHVASAVRAGAKILALGTIEGFHARKFTTDVRETPFFGQVLSFATSQGLRLNYVNPTKMLSVKCGDDITSPFTVALTNRRNVRGPVDALDWAMEDYLSPLEEMLRVQRPYRRFTKAEVLSGDADLTPTNLKTSTGPPYNTRKINYMRRLDDGSWAIEPNMAADDDILTHCLERGEIPGAVINACLKAEAISAEKASEFRMRLLEVGAHPLSGRLKELLGWLSASVKANKSLYEMSIGMNAYGLDAERLHERMSRGKCFDGDLKMQDASTSTQYMDTITAMMLRLTEAAGAPAADVEELRLVLLSFGDRLMCVLGDVVAISGGNPSGWYGTAYFASFVTILLLRCSYYLTHVDRYGAPPTTTYRAEVATEVQGDDNINNVADPAVREWFSGESVAAKAPLYGHVYTGSAKDGSRVEWKDVSELSYLKRSFAVQVGMNVMPLELKSIAKQLLFYREPAGGCVEEQLAVNITNASRELSLHGPTVFANWLPLLERCASFGDVGKSRFLRLRDWDDTFSVVVTGEGGDLPVEEFDADGAVFQGTLEGAVNLDTALSSEVVRVDAPPAAVFLPPQLAPPGAVQHRAVKVRTVTLTTADTTGSTLASFDVVASLMLSTQLTDVFDRYYSMAWQSITLRLQHSSSGSMYGRYVVCAVPEAKCDGAAVARTVSVMNCTHPNHQYSFNPANNEDIEFTLPYFGVFDSHKTLDGANGIPIWRVSVICVCPLTDAVNAAGASSSTVTMIANFNGVRFGAPVYQGPKKTIRPSTIVSAAAVIGGAIMSIVPGGQPFLPIALGLAAAGKMMAEAGHTRHREPVMAMQCVERTATGLGPVDGVDRGLVVDWIQAAQVTVDPTYAGVGCSVDEMSFSSLAKRRHILAIPTLATTQAVGYVLSCLAVTPFLTRSVSGNYCLQPLAHAAVVCSTWRSTMVYDVTFACNALQSGSVFVYWHPDFAIAGSTIGTDFVSGAAGCILEVDPVKRYRISVPWAVQQLASRVKVMTAGDPDLNPDETNGYLRFVVLNPLAAPYVANVQMVIEVSVGDDFQFGGVRNATGYINVAPEWLETKLMVQGTLTEGGEETEDCWLGGVPPPTNLDGTVLSSKLTSVKALCQRYCPYPGVSATSAGYIKITGSVASTVYDTKICVPFYPVEPAYNSAVPGFYAVPSLLTRSAGATVITNSTSSGFTMIGWLGSMFMGARGGMSHKIVLMCPFPNTGLVPVSNVKMFQKDGVPLSSVDAVSTNTTAFFPECLHGAEEFPRPTFGPQSFDFVLPYNTNKRFQPISCIKFIYSLDELSVVLSLRTGGNVDLKWMSAGAADFSLVGFRFAPHVKPGDF